jgi:flagellar hook-length control protein FliK
VTTIDVLAPDPPSPSAGRASDPEHHHEPAAAEGAFCEVMEQELGSDQTVGPDIAGAGVGTDAQRAGRLDPRPTLPTELTTFAGPLVEVVAELPTDDDIDADAGAPPTTPTPTPAPSPTLDLATTAMAGPTPTTATSTATSVSPPTTTADTGDTAALRSTPTASTSGTDRVEAGPPPAPSTDQAPIAPAPSHRPVDGDEAPVLPEPRPAGAATRTQPEPASGPEVPASGHEAGASPTTEDPVVSATASAGTDRTTAPAIGTGATPPPRTSGPVAAPPAPPVPELPGPRTTEPTPAWRQVADALVGRAGGDTSPVTIELHPAELGAVRAEISMRDGALRVDLSAATRDAQAMLEQAIGELRHDLHRLGMRLGHVEVHHTHGGAGPEPETAAAQGDTASGRSDTTPDRRDGSLAHPRPDDPGPTEARTATADPDWRRSRPGRLTTQVDLNL